MNPMPGSRDLRLDLFLTAALTVTGAGGASLPKPLAPAFTPSDRCVACHNGLRTTTGEDVSIGYDWRASVMANSSRDPYWQASVRRETTFRHPESQAEIEDACSTCHMPMVRYEAKLRGRQGEVFSSLAISPHDEDGQRRTGSLAPVCHQIGTQELGKPESFSGGFVIDPPSSLDSRPVYGPFDIESGLGRIMRTSSEGYNPKKDDHIRKSELCATCHTLYNKALGPGGKAAGDFRSTV